MTRSFKQQSPIQMNENQAVSCSQWIWIKSLYSQDRATTVEAGLSLSETVAHTAAQTHDAKPLRHAVYFKRHSSANSNPLPVFPELGSQTCYTVYSQTIFPLGCLSSSPLSGSKVRYSSLVCARRVWSSLIFKLESLYPLNLVRRLSPKVYSK